MRPFALALFASLALLAPSAGAQARRASDHLARARALDQQGAKAYAEGRYRDAIRYFEEAFRLGGPPFEQWNIAKCYLRLDQPEQAADVLERYLATPNLPPDDQKEAEEQLDQLRKRASTLTVASSPTGASVSVDGKPVEGGTTPLSVQVGPGQHTVAVALPKYAIYTKQVEAKYGRAVILDATLTDEDPPPPYSAAARVSIDGWLGVGLPRHGGVGGDASPIGILAGTYRFANIGPPALSAGLAVSFTGDAWGNTVKATNSAPACPPLRDPQSATATSLFAIGTAGWDIAARFRARAIAGVGFALYFTGSDVGGDLFVSSCDASTGVRAAALLGAQVDYALSQVVHLTAMPISLQVHPAFAGVRGSPVDASGLWLRGAIALGLGVDL